MRNSIFPLTKIIALWNLALKSTSCQFRSATLSTKIGLSSGAVTVFFSLRDELPEFRPKALERIVSVRRILEVSRDLNEGEISSISGLNVPGDFFLIYTRTTEIYWLSHPSAIAVCTVRC